MHIQSSLPIRILSHNIRYATTAPFEGEELWSARAPYLLSELRFNTAHNPEAFIDLQEVLHNQLLDVLAGLPDYTYIGVGRDDGKEAGEYSPILYRPDTWELRKFRSVWLSETPDKPSKGWDAASIRILTVGRFQHKASKQEVIVMNTHLDDQGSRSRYEGARIIENVAKEESEGGLPVVLTGDFNSEPSQEAYDYITKQTAFVDVHEKVEPQNRYGSENTFTGFSEDTSDDSRIDFIFIRKNDGTDSQPWGVQNFAVLANRFDNGIYNSDHRAVVADLLLNVSS
jgi:endonuclease/exonuclease/phosphatase family metal-dependent hydrolase